MNIHQLLDQVQLVDIRLLERNAKLNIDPSSGEPIAPQITSSAEEINIDIHPVSWGKRIETWFRMRLTHSLAVISCAVAVIYERDTDETIDEDVKKDFIERVSVMAAYPYLRAEVQHQVADLRLEPLTLGILRQGEFKISSLKSEEEPSSSDVH